MGLALLTLLIFSLPSPGDEAPILPGTVKVAVTGLPLSPATVRVDGTYLGTITNQQGEFERRLRALPVTVHLSHIGYESIKRIVEHDPEQVFLLVPVTLELEELVVTAEDPAVGVMRKVIERKREWRKDLKTFRVDAYNRFTHRKDSLIVSVIENLSEAYWDRERGWREVVKSRRQTDNIDLDDSFPAAVFVENLYDDDVLVAGHRLLGVTHPDALETYDFTLAGRRRIDNRTVFDIDGDGQKPSCLRIHGPHCRA